MTFSEISEQLKSKLETHPTDQVIKALVLLFKHFNMKEEEKNALHFLLRYNSVKANSLLQEELRIVEINKLNLSLIYWIDELGSFPLSINLPGSIEQFFPKQTTDLLSFKQPYINLVDYFKFRAKIIMEAVQNSDHYYKLSSQLAKFRELHEAHILAIEKQNLILAHEILQQIHQQSSFWQLFPDAISQNLIYSDNKNPPKYLIDYYLEEVPYIPISFPSDEYIQDDNTYAYYAEILYKNLKE